MSVGILLVTHPGIGSALVDVATRLLHKLPLACEAFAPPFDVDPDREDCVFEVGGVPMGVLICEDLWLAETVASTAAAGAKLLLVPNASPFEHDKHAERDARADRHGLQALETQPGLRQLLAGFCSKHQMLLIRGLTIT